jgi:uncharacterized protein YqjF (DUF2071 family)
VRNNHLVGELGILDTVARQAEVATEAGHRPWPLPEQPWSQAQTRRDVLHAHWRVGRAGLARLLPPQVVPDTFEGEAWLGVTAYRVEAFRIRGLPPVPGVASFVQLEVGSPVVFGDRPGLWLFQLETSNQLVVEVLKRTHRLPAYRARVSLEGGDVEAIRDGRSFAAHFSPDGAVFEARPGTLEHFLTERYAFYTADGGRLYRAEVNHRPWELRRARAEIAGTTLVPFPLEGDPSLLASAVQDVLVWPLEEL